MVGVHWTMS